MSLHVSRWTCHILLCYCAISSCEMLIRVYVLLFLVGAFSVVGGVIVNNICEIRPVMCNRTIEILIHIMDQMSHDANSLEITWVVVWKAQIYTPGATAFRGRIWVTLHSHLNTIHGAPFMGELVNAMMGTSFSPLYNWCNDLDWNMVSLAAVRVLKVKFL